MSLNKKSIQFMFVMSFMAIWTALTILALTWQFMFDWPDYVHVNYGVPLVWATHTLNTIVGPVDVWKVDLSSLIVDLLFWLGLMVTAVTVMLNVFARKSKKAKKS